MQGFYLGANDGSIGSRLLHSFARENEFLSSFSRSTTPRLCIFCF